MDLERLPRGTYDNNNQDFQATEGEWVATTEDAFKKEIRSTQAVLKMTQPDTNTTHLNWENIRHGVDKGRSVELIRSFYRKKTDYPKCLICASSITDGGSLSRRDNTTKICSICGAQEALDDAMGIRR